MPVPLPWKAPRATIEPPTREDFLANCHRRFGRTNPELIENPVWQYIARSGEVPWTLAEKFGNQYSFPTNRDTQEREAVWTLQRIGASQTIYFGYVITVGGEWDDYYDSDFLIYNDVVVRDTEGGVWIYGYPRSDFPPTDFHTATLLKDPGLLGFSDDADKIIIIGGLGYPEDREWWATPVYVLGLEDFVIRRIQTQGDEPGWIYGHRAHLWERPSEFDRTWSTDKGLPSRIVISGGKAINQHGSPRINQDTFSLDLETLTWTKLEG